jgi:hypothetical protein
MKRKSRLLAWAAVLVGVVIGALALEVFATAWIAFEEGSYVSARELYARSPNSFMHEATKGTGCTYVDGSFPHPYLAFVHHGDPPCGFSSANNIGLYGTDFPNERRSDRYVVLLTGGSVAAQMGQAAPTHPRFLEEALNRSYASPNGKPFLVLNGGEGGWKEPQQLILFSMYATLVDAVVVLDGFNEFLLFGPNQKLSLEVPASTFVSVNPLFRGEFSDAVTGWMLARVAQAIAANPLLGRSHAAYMIHRALLAQARRWDIMQYERRTRMDTLFSLPKDVVGNPQKIFAAQLDRYRGYELSIAAIAEAHKVKSAFFIQPVPAWGKALTAEEKKGAGDMTYLNGYRDMVAAMLALRQQGLAIYDLGDVFQAESGTIYVDAVHCGYNDGTSRGYELMAARMVKDLGQAWGLQGKQ